jgi:hypothetical protein
MNRKQFSERRRRGRSTAGCWRCHRDSDLLLPRNSAEPAGLMQFPEVTIREVQAVGGPQIFPRLAVFHLTHFSDTTDSLVVTYLLVDGYRA